VNIKVHNLRDYTDDKRKTVDDKSYGGGPGMVMKVEPIFKAVRALIKISRVAGSRSAGQKIVLFSPKGRKFDQVMAKRFSKLDNLIMICGRYEGVDERVAKYIADEEVSVGDYVLTGGEIPAMIVVDAVTRLIPGVIALESLKEESFSSLKIGNSMKIENCKLKINYEYPQYTRPESIIINGKKRIVPKVLLSGNHRKIGEWRKKT